MMITKKICMVGAFAAGKSCLVKQFVHSIFDDRYLSTLGVKISKKEVFVGEQPMSLILWDLEGKDVYTTVNISYLRGAMGFFIVADGTRRETLNIALDLRREALEAVGPMPHYLLVNKADLAAEWELGRNDIEAVQQTGLRVFVTSAKTGQSVEDAFISLARDML
jgi:small GTP-binding protein